MLWLCISLPQLPLEALRAAEPDESHAVIVTECEGNTRWVICCNSAAERVHLKAAMNYTVALAIHPQVTVLERKPKTEKAALERLAAWSYQFSGQVIVGEISSDLRLARTAALWLEIGASRKLFGGFRRLMEQLEQQLELLGYTYRLGIAPTLEGAALLARTGIRVATTTTRSLHARIRSLPITALTLLPEIVQQLRASGVRTMDVLLELPRDSLAKRFGPQTSNFLDRLMGEAADPRPTFRLPDKYQASFEFELEVDSTEALLFPLRRMLREFAGFLRARATGVQHFMIELNHRKQPPTQLRIGLSAPDRNAERFFEVAREQLERTELSAPISMLSLSADQFSMPTALQPDLLSGDLQQTEALTHTIDRLTARLGETSVYGLQTVAEHRPEASWAATTFNANSPRHEFPERPLWLLPEPQPLQMSALASLSRGPERIESGWWDNADVQRDYYIARTANGSELWVFQSRTDSAWYVHGFWS